MTLFRKEAMAARGGRLEGEVALDVPRAWHALAAILLVLVSGAVAWLFTGTTARVTTVALAADARGRLSGLVWHPAIPPGRCGTVRTGERDTIRVCLTGYDRGALLASRDDAPARARRGYFAAALPVAPGTRVEARFVTGRQRLIDALL